MSHTLFEDCFFGRAIDRTYLIDCGEIRSWVCCYRHSTTSGEQSILMEITDCGFDS